MTRLPRRRYGALTLGALVAGPLLLAGCQTNPDSAAIVGKTEISTAQLNATVTAALKSTSFASQNSRAAANRVELGRLITQSVIDALATKDHVSVTPADIASEQQQLAAEAQQQGESLSAAYTGSGVPADQLSSVVRSIALENAIAVHLTSSIPVSAATIAATYRKDIGQFESVHAAHILVKTQALAETILRKVEKKPATFAALAKKYSTDTGSAAKGGDLGTAPPAEYVAPFAAAVETMPVGSYKVVHSQFGWHVIHLESRTVTKSLAQATSSIKQQLLSTQENGLLQNAVNAEMTSLHIVVNPRYGVWNPKKLAVDPPPNSTSTPASSTPSSAP